MFSKKPNTLKVAVKPTATCFNYKQVDCPYPLSDGPLHELLHDEVSTWDCQHPVFLDVPTGGGKTTFVYEELLSRVQSCGGNLLIVSNRLALSIQQKLAIMDRTGDMRKNHFTKEGLRYLEDFGNVRILTYHRLPSLLKDSSAKAWLSNLTYVVFDEAHFFTSDAVFNENCDYLLKLATSCFCRSVRVYMSATMWDVLDPIIEAEFKNYHNLNYPHPAKPLQYVRHYYRQASYDGYELHFVDDLDSLIPEINKDPLSRWLVFVDSKEKGKSLAKKLKGCAAYLDSEHKSGPVWDTLLDQEHFDAQVLICTAVLDCGCNVNESSLRNIVITTDDRTSFIQMLGRKRRTDKKTVRVWVHNISNQTISFRRRQCEIWLSWYTRFDSCVTQNQRMKFAQDIWRSEDAALRKLFRLGNQNVFPNELARYSLARRFAFYDELLNGDTTFQEAVKQWVGHSSTNCDDSSDLLETFYQKHKDQALFDVQQTELRELIVRMCKDAGIKEPQKRRCEVHQHGALNNRLKALGVPYEISLASEGGWHFRKFS